MLNKLIKTYPEFKQDILNFYNYIKTKPRIEDAEWHLHSYPSEIISYFLNNFEFADENRLADEPSIVGVYFHIKNGYITHHVEKCLNDEYVLIVQIDKDGKILDNFIEDSYYIHHPKELFKKYYKNVSLKTTICK